MISSWWWAALGVAGVGVAVLGVVDRVLRAEGVAVARAAIEVDRARATIDGG